MTSLASRITSAGGVFVTGTDTEVGKTVASALLVRALGGSYWKPVQSGMADGGDSPEVQRLAEIDETRVHPPAYEMTQPLSPHQAARGDGIEINMADFVLPDRGRPVVVEGAGGVLVPLNAENTMIDLMDQLQLPVIVVARSGLGTINHTLLSLESLRKRGLDVLGVIMNGPRNVANAETVSTFGKVPVLLELEPLSPLEPRTIASIAARLGTAMEGEQP